MILTPATRAQLAAAAERVLTVAAVLLVLVGAVHVVVLGEPWALTLHAIALALIAPTLVPHRSTGRHHARGHGAWSVRR